MHWKKLKYENAGQNTWDFPVHLWAAAKELTIWREFHRYRVTTEKTFGLNLRSREVQMSVGNPSS